MQIKTSTHDSPDSSDDSIKEYEQMLKDFEHDKKKHDFFIPPKWDKDFRKAMTDTLQKKYTERRKHRLVHAAGLIITISACFSVFTTQVEGIQIFEHFRNTFHASQQNHDIHATVNDTELLVESDVPDTYYKAETLEELFIEIHDDLKMPMFYIEDTSSEYEMYEAKYNHEFKLLSIILKTDLGKIYFTQEFLYDNTGAGTLYDNGNVSTVYNDSLSEEIKIYSNTENDENENYYFLIYLDSCKFFFNGTITLNECEIIAKNIYYK